MHLKVEKVDVVTEKKKFDGSVVRVAECLVGDPSGSAILLARNEQLEIIKEGATITVLNALAKITNKFLKLDLDKWSKV